MGDERKSGYDTGAASEFLVLSMLYRLGLDAFISLGNKKAIDIVIKSKNGKSLTMDVKAVRGYSSIVVNNVQPALNHFIIAVVYKNAFDNLKVLPDFYIIPSKEIPKLHSDFNGQLRLMSRQLSPFLDRWEYLKI